MGVYYFPCTQCQNILADCNTNVVYCRCNKGYCNYCAEDLNNIFPKPEDFESNELYKCRHCDVNSRIDIIKKKIKKLNDELANIESQLLINPLMDQIIN